MCRSETRLEFMLSAVVQAAPVRPIEAAAARGLRPAAVRGADSCV